MDFFLSHLNSTSVGFIPVEISKAFLIFLMFSVIGWISEVLYVGIFFEHRFVNRGFLHGPLCPIYGSGGLLILSLPKCLQNPVWVLFLSGLFFCSIVEYFASWAMEKMFHAKWWDYSNHKIKIGKKEIPTNINGRVCLLNSILFGIMTVGVIKFVQPLIEKFLSLFADAVLQISASLFCAVFIFDLAVTVRKLVDFSVYMEKLKEKGEELREKYRSEEWYISSHKAVEAFISRFPTMKSARYHEQIVLLRGKLKEKLQEKIFEKKLKKDKKN